MRFLVDANVPLSVAPRIRALGHEATDLREIAMGNADDGVLVLFPNSDLRTAKRVTFGSSMYHSSVLRSHGR